jgi:DNA-binding transcriptional regulator YhcF (GntR family)
MVVGCDDCQEEDVRSKIMLFEQIRRDSRVEGLSVRALAKRHRVHRRTVRQALASAMPPEPARRRWQSRKIDPFVDAIDAMLRSDLTAPRKQRHTAVRVLDRLVDEHQATGLSYSTLRAYVAQRRREIWAEAGRPLAEVFVPQTHQPAAEGTAELAERRDMPLQERLLRLRREHPVHRPAREAQPHREQVTLRPTGRQIDVQFREIDLPARQDHGP